MLLNDYIIKQDKNVISLKKKAIAAVGLNTRLGCLNRNLAPNSEAQKMIDAVLTSFSALSEMIFSIPIWKYYMTKDAKMLFEAQDFFTE